MSSARDVFLSAFRFATGADFENSYTHFAFGLVNRPDFVSAGLAKYRCRMLAASNYPNCVDHATARDALRR